MEVCKACGRKKTADTAKGECTGRTPHDFTDHTDHEFDPVP